MTKRIRQERVWMEAYELWVVWRLCIEAIAIDGWLLPAVMEMEPMEVVVGQEYVSINLS